MRPRKGKIAGARPGAKLEFTGSQRRSLLASWYSWLAGLEMSVWMSDRSVRVTFLTLLLLLPVLPGCQKTDPSPEPVSEAAEEVILTQTPGLPWFEDVTTVSGIDFRHFDSATPKD